MEEFANSFGPIVFGHPLLNLDGTLEMIVRFVVNVAVIFSVVRLFYYPKSHRRDYVFTFMLFAVCIFMLIFLMEGSKLKIGAALGLFAIFGILRYRTEAVPIREMTYLFLVVSMSVVNAMAIKIGFGELIIANLLFIISVWSLEHLLFKKQFASKYVKYDKIALIVPEKHDELVADLNQRLGVDVKKVEVGSVDFLKDMALIRVYYVAKKSNSVDQMTRMPKNYE